MADVATKRTSGPFIEIHMTGRTRQDAADHALYDISMRLRGKRWDEVRASLLPREDIEGQLETCEFICAVLASAIVKLGKEYAGVMPPPPVRRNESGTKDAVETTTKKG